MRLLAAFTAIVISVATELTSLSASEPFPNDTITNDILISHCGRILPTVESATARNDVRATKLLAVMYDRGCGVSQDMPHALRIFSRLAHSGTSDPLVRAYVAMYGPGASLDGASGITLLKTAHASGDPFAARMLGFFLSLIGTKSSSPAGSFHWDEIASNAGDVYAMAFVAQDLAIGIGTAQDVGAAKKWLGKPMSANAPVAFEVHGRLALAGVPGFHTDRDQAFAEVRKAALLGSADAKVAYSNIIRPADFHGRVSQSEARTMMREGVAAQLPRRYFDAWLGEFYMGFHGNTPDYAAAVPLLKEGLPYSFSYPDRYLAVCYFHGFGVAVDNARVMKYYKSGVAKGDLWSKENLQLAEDAMAGSSTTSQDSSDIARDYQGAHWSDLHPMQQLPQPGSPADPNGQ